MPLAKKPSALQTELRRGEVRILLLRGASQAEIARTLNVGRKTIARDVEWVKDQFRRAAGDTDELLEIGTALARLDQIEHTAIQAAEGARSLRDKSALLRTSMDARLKRIELLLVVGLISEKPPPEFALSFREIKVMSTDALMAKRAQLIQELKDFAPDQNGNASALSRIPNGEPVRSASYKG